MAVAVAVADGDETGEELVGATNQGQSWLGDKAVPSLSKLNSEL